VTLAPMPEVWHHPEAEICGPQIDHAMCTGGKTIRLADGRIMMLYSGPVNPHNRPPGTCRTYMRTSADECATWSAEREIIHHPECQAWGGPSLRDHEGALWVFYLGFYASVWDKATNEPDMDKTRSDLWAARSLDEGETWGDNQMIFGGYTGASNDAKVASSGHIIVPFSYLVPQPGRLVSACVVSPDGGATWELGEAIDIGQQGDHAGALEPVIVELQDGRIWMLIRTDLGHFLQAFSEDHGLSWSEPTPTQITSPSAPCHIIRLASGRLALIWNNFGEMSTDVRRSALSMALSEDDGQSWTEPVVCLRALEAEYPQVSYPCICEISPGEMLVSCNHVLSGWNRAQPVLMRISEKTLLNS